MADYNKRIGRDLKHGAVPYGNAVAYPFSLTTTAAGVPENSNATVALAIVDTIKLGILPAGTRLLDMVATVSDVFTALATAKIGFAYVDGVDVAAAPQNASYFVAALDLNVLAVSRKTAATRPVTLPKDAYLVLDLDGAALAAAGILDVVVLGEMVGAV